MTEFEWDYEETCPCGALIQWCGDYNQGVEDHISQWRVDHKEHKARKIDDGHEEKEAEG